MTGAAPLVSVVMPVYRVERYVADAVGSVLRQTWSDFELIVVDDASPDASMQVVAAQADPRIRIVRHERNLGLAAARNSGIAAARGRYIALLDSDDMAPPTRLARQVDTLSAHPQLLGCGGRMRYMRPDGTLFGMNHRLPLDADVIAATLLFHNTVYVSTLMMRAEAMKSLRYRADFAMAEDYEMITRATQAGAVINLDETLLHYRIHGASLTATQPQRMVDCVQRICRAQLAGLDIDPDADAAGTHHHAGHLDRPPSAALLDRVQAWLLALRDANRRCRRYDSDAFDRVLGQRWFEVCTHAAGLGAASWRRYRGSTLSSLWQPPAVRHGAFGLKCLAG